jgi:hypothetical protein
LQALGKERVSFFSAAWFSRLKISKKGSKKSFKKSQKNAPAAGATGASFQLFAYFIKTNRCV